MPRGMTVEVLPIAAAVERISELLRIGRSTRWPLQGRRMSAVGTAIRASRLYVPVRTLPEEYDQPYRFWRPVPGVTAAVLDTYKAANQAAARAAAEVDAVALTAGTPSSGQAFPRGRAGLLALAQKAPTGSRKPSAHSAAHSGAWH